MKYSNLCAKLRLCLPHLRNVSSFSTSFSPAFEPPSWLHSKHSFSSLYLSSGQIISFCLCLAFFLFYPVFVLNFRQSHTTISGQRKVFPFFFFCIRRICWSILWARVSSHSTFEFKTTFGIGSDRRKDKILLRFV